MPYFPDRRINFFAVSENEDSLDEASKMLLGRKYSREKEESANLRVTSG